LRLEQLGARWKDGGKIVVTSRKEACIALPRGLGMKCRSYEATVAPTTDPVGLRERLRGGPHRRLRNREITCLRGETMSSGRANLEHIGTGTRCRNLERGGGLFGDEPARS